MTQALEIDVVPAKDNSSLPTSKFYSIDHIKFDHNSDASLLYLRPWSIFYKINLLCHFSHAFKAQEAAQFHKFVLYIWQTLVSADADNAHAEQKLDAILTLCAADLDCRKARLVFDAKYVNYFRQMQVMGQNKFKAAQHLDEVNAKRKEQASKREQQEQKVAAKRTQNQLLTGAAALGLVCLAPLTGGATIGPAAMMGISCLRS